MNRKLVAWWAHRQGLLGPKSTAEPATVLASTGWARSVGGASPYLSMFARAGTSRERVDQECEELFISELPAVRGCTYVVGASDFSLALQAGKPFGSATEVATAKKLGVTDEEIEKLKAAVLNALKDGHKDPAALKAAVGDASRNLGEEGKKRGLTTTLPLATGLLQTEGAIIRRSLNGRIDTQRYAYALWNLPASPMSEDEVFTEVARRYFKWIGPASVANFRWFTALGAGVTKKLLEPLGLVAFPEDPGLLIFPEDLSEYEAFSIPKEPDFRLVGSLDGLFLLRRDHISFVEEADLQRPMVGEKTVATISTVADLLNNAILDRGRIVGLWEYDPVTSDVVYESFIGKSEELTVAVKKVEAFAREQLGDVRSFSLDSPEARKPKLAALRSTS